MQMPIELTDAAAARVRAVLARTGGHAIRLGVKPSGCSGYSYTVGPAEDVHEDDLRFEAKGVEVVVRPEHAALLQGATLDYRREGLNEAFRFENPNARDHCGCGESFSV
jgi:iron-sulfur cluster assembly protein